MIGAGGWGAGVEVFWAAASFRVDDGFVGEVRLSAVWPGRTSRGPAWKRTGHARDAFESSGNYGEKINYLTADINTILTISNEPTSHIENSKL